MLLARFAKLELDKKIHFDEADKNLRAEQQYSNFEISAYVLDVSRFKAKSKFLYLFPSICIYISLDTALNRLGLKLLSRDKNVKVGYMATIIDR